MTIQQKYDYWLDIAQYDLETAKAMLSSGRWFYVVFMCQQAVEKLSKGLYTLYVDDNISRIHNIRTIIEHFDDKLPISIPDDKFDFFDTLSAYYLNNRYPDFISKLSLQVKETEATKILSQAEEVFSWLLTLRP